MITQHHLTTICGALRYWEEEITPHNQDVMKHYLDAADPKILSAREIAALRQEWSRAAIRYALVDPVQDQLISTRLFIDPEAAWQAAGSGGAVAAVLVPGDVS